MQVELIVAYYEGDLKVWDSVYIDHPTGKEEGDVISFENALFEQHPEWKNETIAFLGVLDNQDSSWQCEKVEEI